MSRITRIVTVLILFSLTACANRAAETGAGSTSSPVATTAVSQRTATVPAATATPAAATATPTATPNPNRIEVSDQPLNSDGKITIDQITLAQDGWVVLHAVRADNVAEILGFTAVSAGTSADVVVQIDSLQTSNTLVAMLHVDEATPGEFEFPGVDDPITAGDTVVAAQFMIDIQVSLPDIHIEDQDIVADGLLHVENVRSPSDSWLLIYADDNGSLGTLLGFAFIEEGQNENIQIPLDWRQGTPKLFAVLYEDNGEERILELPDIDLPLLLDGNLVLAEIQVTYPPDVYVLNQPLVNDRFVVERVISDGPGWIVVHFDDGGNVGLIIGFAPLQDGLNEQVEIEVIPSAVTEQLYIALHEDTEIIGEFEFPRADPQITYQGFLIEPFPFRTDAGNYLITRDQTPQSADEDEVSITVPLAVIDLAGWVSIWNEADGQPGSLLGAVQIVPGINRDLQFTVNSEDVTETMYAIMHLDTGEAGEFEFPDGPDVPLQRNFGQIQAPFMLTLP